MVLNPPDRRIEGVANCDIDILMRLVLRSFLHMHVLPAGHADIDPHLVELSLVLTAMRRLDGHVAAYDTLEKTVELGGFLANDRFHSGGRVHVAEADLQGYLHVLLLFDTPDTYDRRHRDGSTAPVYSQLASAEPVDASQPARVVVALDYDQGQSISAELSWSS